MIPRTDLSEVPFHARSLEEALADLGGDLEDGLSEKDAERRREAFGPNEIERERKASAFMTLLAQLKSPLILILVAAAIVTVVIGDYQDAAFILAAVLVNAGLGYYQEHKAEKALAELSTYLRQRARVIRDGAEREIDATELVPGDLIRLAQGDRVPADARLAFANDLQADEAVLTGEAYPVEKRTDPVAHESAVGDQSSLVFAGTLATQGVGTALVVRTGGSTELGRIAALVGSAKGDETPLQKSIRVFSVRASAFLAFLTAAIFAVGIMTGRPLLEMFVTAVAVAVSAVPEGLPIAMTVILAVGVERMARRKGVVRKLAAAEALGSTDVILTDKTGTLTTARMEIGALIPEPGRSEDELLALALTNASAVIENPGDDPREWRIDGRIIEASLVRSAALRGVDVLGLRSAYRIKDALPFNAVNKFSSTLVEEEARRELVFVGAPDVLLGYALLPEAERERLRARIEREAGQGALVLGVATASVPRGASFSFRGFAPERLSLAGLITLHDPIREQVPGAIKLVEESGIRVVLVTGDHRGTAESVARACGMRLEAGSVIEAAELRELSDEALSERLERLRVVARVSPLDKMRIVEAFQRAGKVVAMTGDGVNDAPSIKRADVGVAMGSGTAVARDVADLVLLDDNFVTIVAAVEEGRQIRSNLKKVLVYLLSDTADALFLIGGALVFGLALPLNALQILWVNFFSDSFPAVAFAFEREREAVRRRSKDALFDPLMLFLIIAIGTSTSALLFGLYYFLLARGYPAELVRTFTFACFASYTLFSVLALRSLSRSIFSYSFFSNPAMLAGVCAGAALILVAVYVPFFERLLDTVALPLPWMLGVAGVVLANLAAIELAKGLFRWQERRRFMESSGNAQDTERAITRTRFH